MKDQQIADKAFNIVWAALLRVLKENKLSLSDLDDIHDLDDLLEDGGQARCEEILDLGDTCIVQFYPFTDSMRGPFWTIWGQVLSRLQAKLTDR